MAPGRGPGDAKSALVSESEWGEMEKPASGGKTAERMSVYPLRDPLDS